MSYHIECNRCGTLKEIESMSASQVGYSSIHPVSPVEEYDDPWNRSAYHLCGDCAKELARWLTQNE